VSGATASVFGGARVQLLEGNATLRLQSGHEAIEWKALVCFFTFSSSEDETVILGHAGFLDYFTATFDAQSAILSLLPNQELPVTKPRRKRRRFGKGKDRPGDIQTRP
jgi:hypothetical protein